MHVVDVGPTSCCAGASGQTLFARFKIQIAHSYAILQTLIPFLRNLLSRRFSNYSFEVMTLLAGSLERSDSVFTVGRSSPSLFSGPSKLIPFDNPQDLVSAIDLTLQDVYAPSTLDLVPRR